MSWLLDPYRSQFMQHALLIALMVGVLSPAVGVWVVLRRLSYMGDAMSHGSLAGVAGAYLLGVNVLLGALVSGLVMGGAVALLTSHRRLSQDATIGVVETGLFSLGVILIGRADRAGVDLSHFLFGQLTTVTSGELVLSGALTALALVALAVSFDDLRMATFDPLHARQVGVHVARLRVVVLVALSIAIVVCLSTVGLLMSVAMLIVPASSTRMLSNRVSTMTLVAVGSGVFSAVVGLTLSYHLSSPPGATIALLAVVQCLLVFAITLPRRDRHHHEHRHHTHS